MINKLILHPTDTSQWYTLVNEAEAATKIILNENTESYLVFLLMRFVHNNQLFESILAVDFLNAMQLDNHHFSGNSLQLDKLREIGDKSLLFAGLFPDIADRKNVSVEYFSDMGQTAYLMVGELYQHDHDSSVLYFQLSMQFKKMQNILGAMRNNNSLLES